MTVLHRLAPWIALLLGATLSLAFAPFNFWPLAVICPAFLFLAWRDTVPKRAALLGFLFTFGLFVAGTYWLYHSVYVIGHAPIELAFFLMLALAAIMGLYSAALGYVQAKWLPRQTLVLYLLALPSAWTLIEWLRGWLFTGFPWLAIGYTGLDTPLAGLAPIIGVYGLSFLLALSAGAFALLLDEVLLLRASTGSARTDQELRDHSRSIVNGASSEIRTKQFDRAQTAQSSDVRSKPSVRAELVEGRIESEQVRRQPKKNIFVGIVILVLSWLIAFPLWHHEWTQPIDKPISVAIVQGSVEQEMKWTQAQHDATLKLYRDLTVPHWGAQLIVWPESALPDWAESLGNYLSSLWQDAQLHRSDLIIGQIHMDDKGNAYNGVLALSDKVQWYDKRHLVPYGEYFPVPQFVREWMRSISLPYSDFTPGAKNQPPLRAAGENIGASVCYEDAYASSQLAILRDATVLVNVTNDAWFGDTTARHQHLQIARMRALEAGRPLIRAANDGISGLIDADGHVISQLPSFKSAVLTGVVQPRTGLTPYARVGNWAIVIVCLLALSAAIAVSRSNAN